jgi:hypothetical protein
MFYSSARRDCPDRFWLDILREYRRPVAVLARPEPGWGRRVGHRSVDGLLQRIDLGHCEERTMLVQVTSRRRLPEHVRVFSTLEPDVLLREFLLNSSPDGPIRLPGELSAGVGRLVVDGSVVEGSAARMRRLHRHPRRGRGGDGCRRQHRRPPRRAVHLTFDTTASSG